MIFGSSLVLDDYFNIAHFYKIISYLLPCTILIYSIAFSNKENIDKLNKTIGAQSLFLAIISHEFKTPLSNIIGLIEILLESELNDTQKCYY